MSYPISCVENEIHLQIMSCLFLLFQGTSCYCFYLLNCQVLKCKNIKIHWIKNFHIVFYFTSLESIDHRLCVCSDPRSKFFCSILLLRLPEKQVSISFVHMPCYLILHELASRMYIFFFILSCWWAHFSGSEEMRGSGRI